MPIELRHLTKAYGEKVLFSDLSYPFPQHGLIALCGPSGSGKTTLLRILAGLETADGGEVLGLAGRSLSVAFQQPRLLPRQSAFSNVLAVLQGKEAAPLCQSRAREMLECFFAEQLAQKRTEALSGGEQQRVSLARAFAVQSEIVLLDEPTANMDAELAEAVTEKICAFARQRLILLASHNPRQLERADGSIVLGRDTTPITG